MDNEPVATLGSGRKKTWLLTFIFTTNALLLSIGVFVITTYGSLQGAINFIKGQKLVVDSTTKSFGSMKSGERVTVSFLLTNKGYRPVRIAGCASGCICTVPEDLPFEIGVGDSRQFNIDIKMPPKSQAIELPLTIYTNMPSQPELPLTITGRVDATDGS